MHKSYLIKKVSEKVNGLDHPAWSKAQVQTIAEYPWKGETKVFEAFPEWGNTPRNPQNPENTN